MRNPIAYKTLTWFSAIGIFAISADGEEATVAWVDEHGKHSQLERVKIEFNEDGEPKFEYCGRECLLSEFMRTNYPNRKLWLLW